MGEQAEWERVETVAQVLYRQHRASQGWERQFGEWDRAGASQEDFRAKAREVLAVLPRPATPRRADTERIHAAWRSVSDFAGRHSASLATAAADPRDPTFGDDWCALVQTLAEVYAHTDGHDPRLLPQGYQRAADLVE